MIRDGPRTNKTPAIIEHDGGLLMKKTEKTILIEGLRKLSADAAQIADALEGKAAAEPERVVEEPEQIAETEEPKPAPEQNVTYEDMRAVLADKSRSGYRAEVKALLASHGVDHLSEITDPAEMAQIVKEAEVIGNG